MNNRFPCLEIQYTVSVQTGSATNAGTDANVFITLVGDKNKITRHPLKKTDSGKNPFEKGHTDDFTFDHDNVGKVCLLNCDFFSQIFSLYLLVENYYYRTR